MTKHIFIAGVAKSGKSTFAEKICANNKYNHIPLDYFASSLKHNFPETKITSNVVIEEPSSSNLALLLSRVMNIMNDKDEPFIIDSAHILPRDIIKYIDKDKWDIYYFGYPNITSQDKFNLLRRFDGNESWTRKRTDEELLNTLTKLVELSKQIEKECKQYNLTFIDTSKDLIKDIENAYIKYINN
jgi:adenylate kinase family enzyme